MEIQVLRVQGLVFRKGRTMGRQGWEDWGGGTGGHMYLLGVICLQSQADGFFPSPTPWFATGSLGPRERHRQLHCVSKVLLVNRPGLEPLDLQAAASPGLAIALGT